MKLYTTGQGHWAGTQADARKVKREQGLPCELYEVPVSKQELLAFLNTNEVATTQRDAPRIANRVVPKHTMVDDGSCPSLEEVRKQDPTMNENKYVSYKRGWLQVKNKSKRG
jgi:hypothetical protein